MSEPVFQRHTRGLTLAEIVALTGATPPPAPLLTRRITNVAPLDLASPSDLTFFDNKNYTAAAGATHAGACFASAALAGYLPAHVAVLVVPAPYRAFLAAVRELFPDALRSSSLAEAGSVAGAHVDPAARLEDGVTIEPGAVIGPRAEIGSGSLVGATAVIGSAVRIGRNCSIGAGAVVANALIGDRVIIHPGCRIGQDGFGFVLDLGSHLKVPQLGRVIIQDDVEIGAGSTIDRGAIRDTVIGEGSKIDNQVQIGHNVTIGRYCIIVAQCGIAGSSTLGDFVALGGGVGVSDHVTIGEGAQLAAASNAHADIPPGERFGGTPAKPLKLWFREIMTLARLARTSGETDTADERDKRHG